MTKSIAKLKSILASRIVLAFEGVETSTPVSKHVCCATTRISDKVLPAPESINLSNC